MMKMLHKIAIVAATVTMTATIAQAQTGPIASQCSADIAKYCADKKHYGGAVRACLEDHKSSVSDACSQALDTMGSGKGAGLGQQMMSPDELTTSLTDLGYTDIRKIERERRATYEVKARDPQGVRVELYVDGMTGKILRSKPDN